MAAESARSAMRGSSNFFASRPRPRRFWSSDALEGAHTFILAQRPGVNRVLALEGREANLRKARFVQELLQVANAEFAQANLEKQRPGGVWKIRRRFLFGPFVSPAGAVETDLPTSGSRAHSIHLDALRGGRGGEGCRARIAREDPRRRRRRRAAQRNVGDRHLADAGIAVAVLTAQWISERPCDRQRSDASERTGGDDRRPGDRPGLITEHSLSR